MDSRALFTAGGVIGVSGNSMEHQEKINVRSVKMKPALSSLNKTSSESKFGVELGNYKFELIDECANCGDALDSPVLLAQNANDERPIFVVCDDCQGV